MSIEDHIVVNPRRRLDQDHRRDAVRPAPEPGAEQAHRRSSSVPRPRGSSPASSPSGTRHHPDRCASDVVLRAAHQRRVHDNVAAVTATALMTLALAQRGRRRRMLCG
ncbi:hypothetical protein HBB16_00280 [Pseudonocardia sp. MCCB 268]|nr:hypothetical protein [Pseudonocardia cytotoxica]